MAMPKNYADADFPVGTSNPDPIDTTAANFEETIEKLREALACICLNAKLQPDAAMDGATDCYAVPLGDIERGHAALKYTQRREG